MPLVLRDEPIENPADDIVAQLGEIVLPEYIHQLSYFLDHLPGFRKGDGVDEVGGIDGLVVYLEDFVKEALQYLLKLCSFEQALRYFKWSQRVRTFGLKAF